MKDEARATAIERAYREHADDVYRLAYAFLRDVESATDATQEAFARAYERWDRYDASRPLRPWLHSIVSRIALDRLRHERVRKVAVNALGDQGPEEDPGAVVARQELVEACLNSVPPQARAALVLRHFYGYSYDEIARVIGTSAGNVGSILTRTHATLRAQLERQETAAATPGLAPDPVSDARRPAPITDRGLR